MIYYDDPNMIKRADLVHGAYYRGQCRNATVARWDATRGRFRHWRTKFLNPFLEYIKHPEDEKDFDVFVPAELIEAPENAIPLED